MSSLLNSEHVQSLVNEDSVRGVLVRRTLKAAEEADSEELRRLEKALQLLLSRFQEMEGQGS
ncbi:MAG: hypothetical protein GWO23_02900 [Gammaproteobacteria bacterium]|nr:hypothetical protein [Gammaproteobacteria bacterium]